MSLCTLESILAGVLGRRCATDDEPQLSEDVGILMLARLIAALDNEIVLIIYIGMGRHRGLKAKKMGVTEKKVGLVFHVS